MKKYSVVFVLLIIFSANADSQNLISNPSFEKKVGGGCNIQFSGLGFDDPLLQPNECGIKDWYSVSGTPDAYWYNALNYPSNAYTKYIYPHSDSVCVGGVFYFGDSMREMPQGKLIKPLIANHHYQFSMYVQLYDTIYANDAGKLVGINSFSALFTDTALPFSVNYLPIQKYTPQVQINTMVTDTQHWVLLMDTFIAVGGEQFVSIGNFKTDAQTQTQLVQTVNSSLPKAAYYFIDDVSLIDLDEVGIEEVEKNKLIVYPNPANEWLTINDNWLTINTIEITDVLGRVMVSLSNHINQQIKNSFTQQLQIDVSILPNGIYFIKTIDVKGNQLNAKFVKE
ncbi:MAG: hypothetical protein RJA07_2794 [Bacteroidota bacterium]|jgi:hypothetical protein